MKEVLGFMIFVVVPIWFFIWVGKVAKEVKPPQDPQDPERIELFDTLRRVSKNGSRNLKILRYVVIGMFFLIIALRSTELFRALS